MTALLLGWILTKGAAQSHVSPVVGKWFEWQITSGRVLLKHPRLNPATLVLKVDGTYTYHYADQYLLNDFSGAYRIRGKLIELKGSGYSTFEGKKGSREPEDVPLLLHNGLLWQDDYFFGLGSCVYAQSSSKAPNIPPHKDWPSFGDFNPG